ncbi:MAG: sulfatase-like hydrolase/transferase, partial [Rubripirellula sp.]
MTPLNHLPRCYAWLLLSPLFLLSTLSYAESPPNIVLILADDLGWNAVGYRNPRMKTPNLDRLVSEGVELRNFYVAPMCSPTRAG